MDIPEEVPWRLTGEELGSGGQGVVQVVIPKNQPDGPKCALKTLNKSDSPQAIARFNREISVIKGMNHPAIVRVFDHSKVGDDFQYYVMEYHKGARSLAEVISSQPNDYHGNLRFSLYLFRQIISAIGACEAFDPQIVHRDISPKNILVLPNWTIRVIDFGICQIEGGTMITLSDEGFGTRYYASPECEDGDDSKIGVNSDLYSAAKVLWSAVTSKQAFPREIPAFTNRSMKEEFPAYSEVWHLTHIFEKTIRTKPEDRVQSTAEVFELIREVRHKFDGGFPPLEEIEFGCPSCGWKCLSNFESGYLYFKNPPQENISYLKCNMCGFAFVRDTSLLRKNIKEREDLA